MAKISRTGGPTKADGTQERPVVRVAGQDVEILGSGADLYVAGDTRFGQGVQVEGAATVDGALTVGGALAVAGDLDVTGDLAGDIAVEGGLAVGGGLTVATTLGVTGDADLDGALAVAGAVDLAAGLDVGGALAVTGTADFTGATSFDEDITTAGGVRTGHDALYKWASDLQAGAGTPTLVTATYPRWVLAPGDSVTVIQEFPTTWTGEDRAFTVRVPLSQEDAGTGNVHLQLGYRFVYLVAGSFTGAKTLVDRGAVGVPGAVGAFGYLADLAEDIPCPAGAFFGDAPQVVFELTRVDDGTDTFAGDLSVVGMFFQRIDL